ncbi:putative stress response RCI peptide [Aspergillus campestris IBT 28561]|uniref:Stress response RCI peptide n=1 Tax=Aspergillus campestris (strain IBT 28561) TaxID=1392248 RepID=A0A2I1D1V6_ASPC2|nr:putative stress response RCI peptide [Aspergillus campestris IBT 28561]PKY03863.1 putative stress response RCI peptide [Aspergillus campestris IBT 28561]
MAGTGSMLCVILITIFIPPLGVFLISGCSADLLINILLTCLGYFPGHIHAFYLEYVYYQNRRTPMYGTYQPAPGVYSDRIKNGPNQDVNYGTVPRY